MLLRFCWYSQLTSPKCSNALTSIGFYLPFSLTSGETCSALLTLGHRLRKSSNNGQRAGASEELPGNKNHSAHGTDDDHEHVAGSDDGYLWIIMYTKSTSALSGTISDLQPGQEGQATPLRCLFEPSTGTEASPKEEAQRWYPKRKTGFGLYLFGTDMNRSLSNPLLLKLGGLKK